jgi:NADH dehydrogenase/NADH:ubiquinone oxidoreductase subunit G
VVEPFQNRRDGASRVSASLSEAIAALKGHLKTVTVLAAPELLLEEFYILRQLLLRASSVSRAVIPYKERKLSEVEEVLVSPDYAANFRGAQLTGLVGAAPQAEYSDVLEKIRRREIEHLLILGDRAIDASDIDDALIEGIRAAKVSVGLLTNSSSPISSAVSYVVPGRSILEKSGLLLNRELRLQYSQGAVQFGDGTVPDWRFLALLGDAVGIKLLGLDANGLNNLSDREVTRWYLGADPVIGAQGLSIRLIKDGGVQLSSSSDAIFSGTEAASG